MKPAHLSNGFLKHSLAMPVPRWKRTKHQGKTPGICKEMARGVKISRAMREIHALAKKLFPLNRERANKGENSFSDMRRAKAGSQGNQDGSVFYSAG
jgi:uncharacterized protein YbbK (DUF523 family)